MLEIGRRRRTQAPPPHIVFEALSQPDRDPSRPWLRLLDDEQRPGILRANPPTTLVWSSLWVKRPDAVVEFDIAADGPGTRLGWTLYVEEPVPDDALVGHLRKRLNQLINADLRYSFGQ